METSINTASSASSVLPVPRWSLVRPLRPLGWLAACVFFIVSVFNLIEQREQLREQEVHKKRARDRSIRLRDEWHSLQLEYATLTGYYQISHEAQRRHMVMPTVEDGNLMVLHAHEQPR